MFILEFCFREQTKAGYSKEKEKEKEKKNL